MNTLHKLIYFGVLTWLLAACGTQPETAVSSSDGASLFNAGITIIDVSATPAPETAVTIIYVTATPQPTATTAPSPVLPKINSRQPSTQTITDRQPTISLYFNQEMEAASVAAVLSVEPFLSTEVTVEDQKASIRLLQPLAFDTEYQFAVDTTAVNLAGQHITRPYTWKLNLKDTLSGIVSPDNSHPDLPLSIQFNYPMDEASVGQALTIKPEVSGKLTWNNSYKKLVFTPDQRLDGDTTFTLSFDGELRDRDGRDLPLPADFTFTTPSSILSYAPQDSNVSTLAPIQIRFDRPMDEAATQAAFQLDPPIDGTFSWFETTLRFKPIAGYLAENSRYTVTILPTALSADGEQIMDEESSWSFTTSAAEDVASFGYGPNAQVLDANGRRAVQFQTHSQDTMPLGFELYRLSLEHMEALPQEAIRQTPPILIMDGVWVEIQYTLDEFKVDQVIHQRQRRQV